MAGILKLTGILPSKTTTLFTAFFILISVAAATAVSEDESVFWIPNTHDNFESLPIELRDVFKIKNYKAADVNSIRPHATYRLTFTAPPVRATWAWTTTGGITLLTSHHAAVATASPYPALTTTKLAGPTISTAVADKIAKIVPQHRHVEASSTASPGKRQKVDIDKNSMATGEPLRDELGYAPTSVVNAMAARFDKTTREAEPIATLSYCFHNLQFPVNPDVIPKAIQNFCSNVVHQDESVTMGGDTTGTMYGIWESSGDFYVSKADNITYFMAIEGLKKSPRESSAESKESKTARISAFVQDCIRIFSVALSCDNYGNGGVVEAIGFTWTLQPHNC